MAKDDTVYIGHMLDAARQAIQLVEGRTRGEFDDNLALRLALVHLIQTIGEAARRVSTGFRTRHNGVPWDAIVGMRHRVVHDYISVDYDRVWDVVQTNLKPLISLLKPLVTPDSSANPS